MFEGYAGTSKAGFRAEAQQEALLAHGEGLFLMVDPSLAGSGETWG